MSPRAARLWACGVLGLERCVAVMAPLVIAALALAAACLWGVFDHIPPAGHAWIIGLVLGAAGLAVARIAAQPHPTAIARWDEAHPHHPLRTALDTVGAGNRDLWAAHQAQAITQVQQMPRPWPRLSLAAHDPMGLRHVCVLLIALGLWRSEPWRWPTLPASAPPRFQAVITPPAYTRQPPQYVMQGDQITAPAGSWITVRTAMPTAALRLSGSALSRPQRAAQTAEAGTVQADLVRSGTVHLSRWAQWARWTVSLVPDRSPIVRWAGAAQRGARDSLVLPVIVIDDYDDLSAALMLADTQKPLTPLRLTPPDAQGVRRLVVDLSASAVAGQTVTVQVVVRDAAGQTGRSTPKRITVPERLYKKPLAQSLVEIRAWMEQIAPTARWGHTDRATHVLNGEPVLLNADHTAHAPAAVQKSATALRALALDSGYLTPDPLIRMSLRAAATRLALARSSQDVGAVSALLRHLADRAESGRDADARAAFEAARVALSDAIMRGASPEERAALTEDLQQAFANLMRSLSAEAKPAGPPAGGDPTNLGDLLALMQEADRLAAAGDVAGAQALLETLGQIMAHLQLSPGSSPATPGQDRLTPLMDEQRRLADQTRRWMTLDPTADDLDTLAQQQQDLAAKAGGLPAVQDDMRKAAEALRMGDPDNALKHQRAAGRALNDAKARAEAARDPLAKALGGKDPLGRRMQLQKGASADPRAEAREILQRIQKRLEDQNLSEDERRYLENLIRSF